MKYFKNVSDLSELRKQYKELLKIHHPDNGGNVADMQEVNSENDKALRDVLEKIINFDGIEILICGQWIWISGNTFQYKKELKESVSSGHQRKECGTGTLKCSEKRAASHLAWMISKATMVVRKSSQHNENCWKCKKTGCNHLRLHP